MEERDAVAADLPPLTGLRALAILGVLACHFAASFVVLLGLGPGGERILVLGGYGVSLFFVLSGFILCHAYCGTRWHQRSYLSFLGKRLARVYPLHVTVLLGTVFLYEAARPFGYNQPAFDLALFFRHLTLTQAWWDYTMGMWNQASWSISAEWFAYLCFPPVVWAMRRITSPWLAFVAAHVVLAVFAGWMQAINVDIAFVGGSALPNIVANFVAGCCAYRAWELWGGGSLPANAVPAALAAVVLLTATVVAAGAVGWWLTLPFPLLIFGLAGASDTLIARLLSRPLMQTLGKSSYAAYIVHGPLQLIAYTLVPFTLFAECAMIVKIAAAFAYPGAMLLAGIAAHRLLEHPARAFIVRAMRTTIHGPDRSA